MKNFTLLILIFITTFVPLGSGKMENKFFTWDDFTNGFGKEMRIAISVYQDMKKSGLNENCLTKMDFTFISNKKDNLQNLSDFLKIHYPYTLNEIHKYENKWVLNGETNEIPITEENLLYWCLDMYKRGYEFDSELDGYGGLMDPKNQIFPKIDSSQTDYYFDKGLDCYNNGDLSGAIINWSLTLQIDPNEPNSYYSRAIVKNELYTWKSALKDYDKAIEIAPDFVSALINRGALKDENGDYKGAISDYESVLAIDNIQQKDKQKAYLNLGNTYLNLKDNKKACENWKKALENGDENAMNLIKKHSK